MIWIAIVLLATAYVIGITGPAWIRRTEQRLDEELSKSDTWKVVIVQGLETSSLLFGHNETAYLWCVGRVSVDLPSWYNPDKPEKSHGATSTAYWKWTKESNGKYGHAHLLLSAKRRAARQLRKLEKMPSTPNESGIVFDGHNIDINKAKTELRNWTNQNEDTGLPMKSSKGISDFIPTKRTKP